MDLTKKEPGYQALQSEHAWPWFGTNKKDNLSFYFLSQGAGDYVPEKVKKAEKKLEENPYDLDAWSILIREAQV